jgi:hypothetical protein
LWNWLGRKWKKKLATYFNTLLGNSFKDFILITLSVSLNKYRDLTKYLVNNELESAWKEVALISIRNSFSSKD